MEAPRATQTSEDANVKETEQPRYKHREKSEAATKDAVPREITEETKPAEHTGISQAILVDQDRDTETTEVSKLTVAKEIEMTDTIDVTEVITGIPSQH